MSDRVRLWLQATDPAWRHAVRCACVLAASCAVQRVCVLAASCAVQRVCVLAASCAVQRVCVRARPSAGRLTGVCLSLLVGLVTPHPGRAAHEWRGYWAAPATLETIAERAAPAPTFEVAHRQPFGMAALAFAKVRWRLPRGCGEVHAGTLRGPSYTEWHAGLGRTFQCGPATLFAGARVFGLQAGNQSLSWEPAGTALARIRIGTPAGGQFWGEGGVVDAGARDPLRLPAVFVGRAGWGSGSGMLVLERCAVYGAGEETTLYLAWEVVGVKAAHGLRWSTGEALLELRFRSGPCDVELGGCWHPELGWTPRFGLAIGGGPRSSQGAGAAHVPEGGQ